MLCRATHCTYGVYLDKLTLLCVVIYPINSVFPPLIFSLPGVQNYPFSYSSMLRDGHFHNCRLAGPPVVRV
jgi:hypothetical protein